MYYTGWTFGDVLVLMLKTVGPWALLATAALFAAILIAQRLTARSAVAS
jgi:hypothetical protein